MFIDICNLVYHFILLQFLVTFILTYFHLIETFLTVSCCSKTKSVILAATQYTPWHAYLNSTVYAKLHQTMMAHCRKKYNRVSIMIWRAGPCNNLTLPRGDKLVPRPLGACFMPTVTALSMTVASFMAASTVRPTEK